MDEVTAVEAAALTGLSERTIRRRIAPGTLHARRISTNRFAIRVDDLPQQNSLEALFAKIEGLEGRVHALEQQRTTANASHIPPAAADEAESGIPAAPLRQLLDQLVHEVDRITPLLSPGGLDTIREPTGMPSLRSGRRGKANAAGDSRSASDA